LHRDRCSAGHRRSEVLLGLAQPHKIPRYVVVVDDSPMTVTGKIRKVAMREETAEKLGLG
jgi:fatty-acyl-CoA synthase